MEDLNNSTEASTENSIYSEISAFNEQKEVSDSVDVVTDEQSKPEESETAEAVKTEKTEEAEETEESDKGQTEETDEEFTLSADSDWETFERERNAYLETVEITPQLQAILDRQSAELAARQTITGPAGETAVALNEAIQQVFETEIKDGQIVPNAKPIVAALDKFLPNEFSAIANEVLSSDSKKYQGFSVFEELLADNFGVNREQIAQVTAYLANPATNDLNTAQADIPAGMDAKLKDAYASLPEPEKFAIQSLLDELEEAKTNLDSETNEFYKTQLERELGEIQGKINAKFDTLQKIQFGIDAQRSQAEIEIRQRAVAAQEFENSTNTAYTEEIFKLADAFVTDLAPKLTFVEGEAQTSQARNILSRVNQALAFEYSVDEKGNVTFGQNALADYYAKQLQSEGVKFDFTKGRQLMQQHYDATRKVAFLKSSKASQGAIEVAESKKNSLMKEIKAEQRELLGQLTAKMVTSSTKALETKVKDAAAKKQKARAVIVKGRAETPKNNGNVRDDIKAYNQSIANGDDLYAAYNT